MSNLPLDYRTPEPKPPNTSLARLLAALSLGVLAVPIIGGAIRSGPLFLLGGLIAPLVGMILAGTGLARGRGSGGHVACGVALLITLLVATFFALAVLRMIV